jgi:membrane-bound lytic murein transglycosylase F
MQVRPIAAEDVGEVSFREPSDNVRTGVRYLKRLEGMFAASTGRDRLALVLAAYNMGPAHVQDAQMLARHYGFDPHRWDNGLKLMLPMLEDPMFHERLPAGYAQGRAASVYVERILTRYDRYRAEAGDVPGLAGPATSSSSKG